jgi:hypothetical protein
LDEPSSARALPRVGTALRPSSSPYIPFVIAIPVKDEEQRLPACLVALSQQCDLLGRPIPPRHIRVAIFANNCTDRSASVALKLAKSLSLDIRVVEARLPVEVAHAGAARRVAMDFAEAWLEADGEPDGVILTTDADSRAKPSWVAANLAEFQAGADAVLGRIDLDDDGKLLPRALHMRGGLEDAYERALTELYALLDPVAYNPWPHHATISGASLGLTRTAYRSVGGCPRVSLGEDKALVALLTCRDAKIRYSPMVHVITSGRTNGRAPGGVADTLLLRSREPEASCDTFLEPFRAAFVRAGWRGRLRQMHGAGLLTLDQEWARKLQLSVQDIVDVMSKSAFGSAWRVIEERSPRLARQLMRPAELPRQISIARRWLPCLRQARSCARQDVETKLSVPIGAIDDA